VTSVRIHDLPARERPRERLAALGIEALSAQELIALVLQSGRRGESALEVAAKLLSEYGGVSSLAGARQEELSAFPGIGEARAAALVASFRLGRLGGSEDSPTTLRSAADAAAVAMAALADARRECVIVLVCDAANRLRRVVRVGEGSVDRSLVPVREILNAVLRHDGRAFAVAHNHPSGDPYPSEADVRATDDLRTGARTVGIRFLDHVVIAGSLWRSAVKANR
jgi:DNA repair protein RadC